MAELELSIKEVRNMSTNGEKKNKTNGKAHEEKNGQKIIPKDVWKEFYKFWDATEYEDLEAKQIQKILGKYLFVPLPKDVRNRKLVDDWFSKIKEMREKGKGGFGGYTVCFKGQKSTLEEVFSDKPLNPATMVKMLHLWINDHHLANKKTEPKANPKVEEKNGKTVKVNNVADLEKAVSKIKPKKGDR
jgi:hypothetical protein